MDVGSKTAIGLWAELMLAIAAAVAPPLIAITRLSPRAATCNENVTTVKQEGRKGLPLLLGQLERHQVLCIVDVDCV
jgi:hypothetical protein